MRVILGLQRQARLHHQQGADFDPAFLLSVTDQYGSVDKQKVQSAGYALQDGGAWLSKDADVLIPAAMEGQIDASNAKTISDRVKIIAEGSQRP